LSRVISAIARIGANFTRLRLATFDARSNLAY
jgi:hypothetical protein